MTEKESTMLITEYLEKKGIRYWRAGSKNVGKEYIGIRCPFCLDRSNHLGIHQATGFFKCLKCGESGGFRKLVLRLGESPSSSREILKKIAFQEERGYPKTHVVSNNLSVLMSDFQKPLTMDHQRYLENRGYDPVVMQKKYSLMSSGHAGNFKHRLIISVIMQGKVVGFTGRDTTNLSQLRYKNSPDTYNLIPRRRWLFNADSVNGKAILVEGPMDAMNLGDGAVALFSTSFSNEQVLDIVRLRLKSCFVMFDGDKEAIRKAYNLAYRLSPFIDHVEVIEMPDGKDPGDMSTEEVRNLKREIF